MKGETKAALFYAMLIALGMIFGALLTGCGKHDVRAPYNPAYEYMNATDWSKDSTMSAEKREYYESLIR